MESNRTINTGSLFPQLCDIEKLRLGFKAVKKNRGSPGIDGVTVDEFESRLEEELSQLKNELESWTYNPSPVRRVEIPKPQGGVRILGIPCIKDRVVQATTKQLLEPILDPQFSDSSYGFRPGRNQQQAVLAAKKYVMNDRQYVVDIDLEKFFDRIHHDRLITRLSMFIADKQILRIIGITLRSGVMMDGLVSRSTEGSVQGSPLSPLLSNVVLDELDKALEERGHKFCRFADDCNIFVRFESDGERIMAEVTKFIEKRLKLSINKEKSKVAKSKFVKFLGMSIVSGVATISRQSMERAKAKVNELTPRGTHHSIETSVKQINSWYVGWANYYGMTQKRKQLVWIEAHIRRRLRARLVKQQKRRRFLYRKLVKRGVSKRAARVAFNSNKGVWALSHHRAIEQAFPNRWFINTLGLKVKSDEPCTLRKYGRW